MHPGYIQEEPEKLIDIENINLNTDVKYKNNNNELIQTEEKAFKMTHNQEISGAFQEKSPDVKFQTISKEEELRHLEQLEKELHNKKVSLREEMNKTSSLIKQETEKMKGLSGCLRNFFIRKKKFDKIRVYFGPNSTQDAVYKHPNNSVRTTKFAFI